MLSPPYSPHAEASEEHRLVSVSQKPLPSSLTPSLNKLDSVLSEDELTDNDELDNEGSSGSVPSENTPQLGQKRTAEQVSIEVSENVVNDQKSEDGKSEVKRLKDESVSPSVSTISVSTSSVSTSSVSTSSASASSLTASKSVGNGSPNIGERRMTTCWDALKTNPAKYLRQERSVLDMYPLRRHSWAGSGSMNFNSEDDLSSSSSAALAASAVSSVSSRQGPGRGRGRRANNSSGAASASASTITRGRKRLLVSDASGEGSQDPSDDVESSKILGITGVRVHDLNLSQIKDYSPSLKSLPPGKSLRAEWKGAPMDLSSDPDLHLLHPAEVHLASVLRLPCDVYLDSKRRLFAEKVHRLRQNLPFRRTDSQKACRIDVNKASRLFGAFEKIGWLEDELFLHFLE